LSIASENAGHEEQRAIETAALNPTVLERKNLAYLGLSLLQNNPGQFHQSQQSGDP
jgi:hypothetical protein